MITSQGIQNILDIFDRQITLVSLFELFFFAGQLSNKKQKILFFQFLLILSLTAAKS